MRLKLGESYESRGFSTKNEEFYVTAKILKQFVEFTGYLLFRRMRLFGPENSFKIKIENSL